MIYFDMDGTLADFEGGVRDICGITASDKDHPNEEQDNRMWEGIRDAGNFYYQLRPIPGAIELFRKVYEVYGDECRILTGIPNEKRGIVSAVQDKKRLGKRPDRTGCHCHRVPEKRETALRDR